VAALLTPTQGASEAAIFARLWGAEENRMSPEFARYVLTLGFAGADRTRMHELAAKNAEGRLSQEEQAELDNYVRVGDLLAVLQSQARAALGKPGERGRG
jgi:hypothetical protein